MQSPENRARIDVLISLLGLIAALSLSVAVLGRLWSYLPLFYATVFSMVALRVLPSARGQLFMAAPLGYRVVLPAGSLVLTGKMYRFTLLPLHDELSVRVGWWQHAAVNPGTGLESFFMFYGESTRYAVPVREAAASARAAKELARINGSGFAHGWHAHQLQVLAERQRRTMAAVFLDSIAEAAAFNVPGVAERIAGGRVYYRFADGSEASLAHVPRRAR